MLAIDFSTNDWRVGDTLWVFETATRKSPVFSAVNHVEPLKNFSNHFYSVSSTLFTTVSTKGKKDEKKSSESSVTSEPKTK